jgi:hypothetical protein
MSGSQKKSTDSRVWHKIESIFIEHDGIIFYVSIRRQFCRAHARRVIGINVYDAVACMNSCDELLGFQATVPD